MVDAFTANICIQLRHSLCHFILKQSRRFMCIFNVGVAMTRSPSPSIHHAGSSPVSTNVLEAIAQVEETDPVDIPCPLYEVIDPDALDTLYRTGGSAVVVEFTYCGYSVTVQRDGEVSVSELGN